MPTEADLPQQTGEAAVIRYADLTPTPWLNGLGVTREVTGESTPDGVLWRVSIADISAAGSFSTFDGLDRNLLVVGGDGLVLDIDGRRHHLGRRESIAFAGEAATTGQPVGGAVQALNLMTRRGVVDGDLRVIQGALRSVAGGAAGDVSVLVALDPMEVRLGSVELRLGPLDAVRVEAPFVIAGDGAAALVTVCASRQLSHFS